MAVLYGRNAAIKLGTYSLTEMGNWAMPGMTTDMIEITPFGKNFKLKAYGLGDFGQITANGRYDITDTTGQDLMISAWKNKSTLTALRLYVNNTSYWTADITNDSSAGALVETCAIDASAADVVTINFTAQASGQWTFV